MAGMRSTIVRFILLVLLVSGVPLAQKPNCAGQGVFRAQDSLRRNCDWPVINKFYRLYNICENVYITEAFSSAIIKALADHWDSLLELKKITSADSTFLDFVLQHIDATAGEGYLRKILANSDKCPRGCESICERIQNKITAALAAAANLTDE
jgi:hypothetical protein